VNKFAVHKTLNLFHACNSITGKCDLQIENQKYEKQKELHDCLKSKWYDWQKKLSEYMENIVTVHELTNDYIKFKRI
jgi:hypothetical protein